MVLETVSSTPGTAEARERVAKFLLGRGFRRERDALVRGSLWGTLSGINPKRWAARVSLGPEPGGGSRLRFDINTIGHPLISEAEHGFWNEEFEAAVVALEGGNPPDVSSTERAVVSSTLRLLGFTVLYAFVFAFAFGLVMVLARQLGISLPKPLTGVGAGIGVWLGIRKWQQADSKARDQELE